jgi:sensor c-di-GMP phosphodiesterase-like protein
LPQILAMAKALDLSVIVEGIETDLQAEYFTGGDQPVFAQGWLFGRPVPVSEFLKKMHEIEKAEHDLAPTC